VIVLIVPPVSEFGELEIGITEGIDEIQRWLAEFPLALSSAQIEDAIDQVSQQLADSFDTVAGEVVSGAVLVLEVVAGLVMAVVVLFFLLKDVTRIWDWTVGLAPPQRRGDGGRWASAHGPRSPGRSAADAGGPVRLGADRPRAGNIGVPLVMPLAVVTFFGAYVPILGATIAGMLAVLVALVANGLVAAIAVLAAILVDQQVESNVFQPVVVGHAVHAHPVAITLCVTAGGVLGSVIGAMVAAPVVAVGAALLGYLRETCA
jgi:putative heme transporter